MEVAQLAASVSAAVASLSILAFTVMWCRRAPRYPRSSTSRWVGRSVLWVLVAPVAIALTWLVTVLVLQVSSVGIAIAAGVSDGLTAEIIDVPMLSILLLIIAVCILAAIGTWIFKTRPIE